MAGTGLRLAPSSSSAAQKLVLLLTALPMALASLAFLLQWRGGLRDPSSPWPLDHQTFPGVDSSTTSPAGSAPVLPPSSSVDCSQILLPLSYPSFPYFRARNLHDDRDDLSPKIVITTSTSASLEQTLPWIFYHKVLGVRTFFLFVEGKAAQPQNVAVLETIPGVKVVYRTKDLEEQQAKSRIWNETWLANFFYKPCNYELFVKQTLNMEMAIVMARDAGMDWIIHLDTDELMHPAGARDYSVRQLLSEVPDNVDIVIFPNYESCIERDDIKDPFSEVSLFKKNYDHLLKETYFGNYKEATRGNPNYFLTYGNGKSAARVQSHLRPNGAHRWHNYMKTPNEVKLEEAAVLHFTYTKFSDLTSRRDRCGCKPTKEDTKRCFMLDFDKNAFIIASTVTEQEMFQWYRERVVWADQQLKIKLLKKGILTRIYAPMTIIDNLRESGIFSSAIASAKAPSMGKTPEFLGNSTGADSPLLITAPRITNRKLGKNEMQAASRRVLWAESGHPSAVPPLSPPSFDDL